MRFIKLEFCCYCFSVLFALSCFSFFPILQIVQGSSSNYMNCADNITTLNIWLIMNGSFEILQIFLSIINTIMKNYILFYILNLFYLFNFVLLIIGGVIFFRDCNDLSSSENILLYFTFAYGYLIVCFAANPNYKNKHENINYKTENKEEYIII